MCCAFDLNKIHDTSGKGSDLQYYSSAGGKGTARCAKRQSGSERVSRDAF
jgi:hypothetical protein